MCHICGQSFMFKRMLTAHQKSHASFTSVFMCQFCTTPPFSSVEDLQSHIQTSHPGGCAVVCNICGRTFESIESLTKHKDAVHNLLRPNTNTCTVCLSQFSNLNELQVHKLTHESSSVVCDLSLHSADRHYVVTPAQLHSYPSHTQFNSYKYLSILWKGHQQVKASRSALWP